MRPSEYNRQRKQTWQERRAQSQEAIRAAQQAFVGVPAQDPQPPIVVHDETQHVERDNFYGLYARSPEEFARARAALMGSNTVNIPYIGQVLTKSEPPMFKRTDPYQDKYPTEKDWVVHAKLTFRQQDLLCCGTKELHGIQGCWVYYNKKTEAFKYEYATPTEFIEFVKNRQMYNGTFRPYYTFTEASGEKNTGIGKKIVDYIEKHKLGEVAVHGPLTNHNSGNKVTLFVWMIDNTRVKNHVTEVDTKAKAA